MRVKAPALDLTGQERRVHQRLGRVERKVKRLVAELDIRHGGELGAKRAMENVEMNVPTPPLEHSRLAHWQHSRGDGKSLVEVARDLTERDLISAGLSHYLACAVRGILVVGEVVFLNHVICSGYPKILILIFPRNF